MTHTHQPEHCQDEPRADGVCAATGPARADLRTLRRVLRREVAGTIGLLTDEHDFRAMGHYRSFTFDDYATYREAVEGLLRTRAAQGFHTTVALFDPEEYADFCTDTGLNPDAPSSRARFTAEIATTGPTIPYDGQDLSDLTPALVDEGVRQATWEYATQVLGRLGICDVCGADVGSEAFARASKFLSRIIDTARPGERHVTCSVKAPETLVAAIHADTRADGTAPLDQTEALEFATVLALGLATQSAGGVVVRATAPGTPDQVYGWRLFRGSLQPLTAGEIFDAYCTDADSGEPISPDSNVDYCVPPDIGQNDPERGHSH